MDTPPPSTTSPPVAELVGITQRFATTIALDRVQFSIRPGEVVALLGPNGAGKTTLVRILMGLIRPNEGTVRLFGLRPSEERARRRVGVMLQVGRVPETLTVREHVHLFSSYYGTPVPLDETLALAGVSEFADVRFGRLSGGQKQRALFALAICGRPDLLVVDEPTVGLDIEARRGFWKGVRAMIARGCSVLLTTHYLDEADEVADRVVILNRGRIIADGTPTAVKRQIGGRTIRCTTSLDLDRLRAIYGVRSAVRDGEATTLVAENAEHVVRELLTRDPHLTNLEVHSARLDEVFLALTGRLDGPASEGGSHVEAVGA